MLDSLIIFSVVPQLNERRESNTGGLLTARCFWNGLANPEVNNVIARKYILKKCIKKANILTIFESLKWF